MVTRSPDEPLPSVRELPSFAAVGARFRRVAGFVAVCGLVAWFASPKFPTRGVNRSAVLCDELRKRGIKGNPADVVWVDTPTTLGRSLRKARAIVRATPPPLPEAQGVATAPSDEDEVADLYLVEAKLSPEGVLLSVGDVFNLTETSAADESRPVVAGELVAFVADPLVQGARPTVGVLDLRGRAKPFGPDWTRLERAQQSLTNLQTTGQSSGIDRMIFALDVKPGEKVSLEVRGSDVVVLAGGHEANLTGAALPAWVRRESGEVSRPGNLVTWAVDRVRLEIGDERMQAIKQLAFSGREYLMRKKEAVTDASGEKALAEDLGQADLSAPIRVAQTDPEIGWPPEKLQTWVKDPLPGEGEWNSLEGDPFIRQNEGLPVPFVTTYLRTDRTRLTVRVFVALWDPRQVELHMMAGSVEPKSATGEAGPGRIPRTPEVMKRVVAASNAGFQAMHGEFGMMADGVVYLPPKPYAATVAKLRDGSTAFGTWPNDPTIPENVLSYRQNMTVMVEDEKFNPYGRTWWGGAVPGAEDKTHTVRTGICMTKEGFVAYFYGNELSPEALAQAMIQTRCKFGIALDMNAGHSGLEFYKVGPAEELTGLGRALKPSEAEGEIQGMPGWKFFGRRLIHGMGLMNFPRYIRPEGRDFFYMTLRHLLPGPALVPLGTPKENEGKWTMKGLAQHGFPYAVATTSYRPEAGKELEARVLKIDPRTVTAEVASAPQKEGGKVVAVLDTGKPGKTSLWHSSGAFSIADEAPVAGALRLASGDPAGAGQASAAVGITDEGGMLVYVETPSPALASALVAVLKKAGASQVLVLPQGLSFALGGDTDLAGKAVRAPAKDAVRLARAEAPGARRFFTDTPLVPFQTWYALQQHRVRYFKKPKAD